MAFRKKDYLLGLLMLGVFGVAMTIYAGLSMKVDEELLERMRSEFPPISKLDSLNDVIVEIYCPPKMKCIHYPYVKLKKGWWGTLRLDFVNDSLKIISFVNVGDSILKSVNKDTVYLKRGGDRYPFLIIDEDSK